MADNVTTTDDGWNGFESSSMWGNTTQSLMTTTISTTTTTTTTTSTTQKPCMPWDYPMCDPVMLGFKKFEDIMIWLCFALGIPGNALTILVISRMKPFNSSSVLLIALASSDLCHVMFRMTWDVLLLDDVIGIEKLLSDFVCRFFVIPLQTLEFYSYSLLVCLTAERFIAVWFPLKMNIWCTKIKAAITAGALLLLCLGACMPYAVIYRRHVSFAGCVIKKKYRTTWRSIYQEKVLMSVFVTLPVILVAVFNLLIIIGLRRSSAIKKQVSEAQAKEKERQTQQINRMLTAATTWFVVMLTPYIIHTFWRDLMPYNIAEKNYENYILQYGLYYLIDVMRFSNVVANFVLYVVAARKFRNELIRILTCGRFPVSAGGKSSGGKTISTTKLTKA